MRRIPCIRLFAALSIAAVISGAGKVSAEEKSFIPKGNLAQFIVDNFDLRTVRSTILTWPPAEKLVLKPTTFATLGMHPKSMTDDLIHFEDDAGWVFDIRIIGRFDMNLDGFEDVAICFIDDGRGLGSYHFETPLLLTRYSNDTPLVAIAFKPVVASCGTPPEPMQ